MGWRRKKNKKRTLKRGAELLEDLIECCDGKSNPIKFFSADEIRKVTHNFSRYNLAKISDFFDGWYSCENENPNKMLIKKTNYGFYYQEGIFSRDITISSMVSGHKNFLKLVGCCLELNDPVSIYDSVKKHYRLDISEQPWKRRMKIAEDIATALAYLHTSFPRPFIYRCMFLEKILLDEDGVAKLTDFSFCVSIPEGETFVHVDDRLEGQIGFTDVNYVMSGIVSEKTDVFAIGIVMQKLLSGKERIWELDDSLAKWNMNDQRRHLQNWLLKFKEERSMDEIADPKMLEKMSVISEDEISQMKAFLMLSLRCVGNRGEVPTMVEVAKELKKIQRSLKNDSSCPSREALSSTLPKIIIPQSSSQRHCKCKKSTAEMSIIEMFDDMFSKMTELR